MGPEEEEERETLSVSHQTVRLWVLFLQLYNDNSSYLLNIYVPDRFKSHLHALMYLILTITLPARHYYYPLLHMRKLKHREVKYLP